jgi:hypothetical protein
MDATPIPVSTRNDSACRKKRNKANPFSLVLSRSRRACHARTKTNAKPSQAGAIEGVCSQKVTQPRLSRMFWKSVHGLSPHTCDEYSPNYTSLRELRWQFDQSVMGLLRTYIANIRRIGFDPPAPLAFQTPDPTRAKISEAKTDPALDRMCSPEHY